RAERWLDVGRAVLEGVGGEMQARLEQTAASFSGEATTLLCDALDARLQSEEGKALFAELKQSWLTRVAGRPLTELATAVLPESSADVAAMMAAAAHTDTGAALMAATLHTVLGHLQAHLDAPSIATWAEALDIAPPLRAWLHDVVDAHLSLLLQGGAFAAWWTDLLD
ncbi:MAG: hypothetical protein ACPGUV_13995, partial [Polyangiales bacterium]